MISPLRAIDAWLSKHCYGAAMTEWRTIWLDAPTENYSFKTRATLATFFRGVLQGAQVAGDQKVIELLEDAIDYTAIADKRPRGITGYEPLRRTT